MFDPSKAEHVYIAAGCTNLSMRINGLSSLVLRSRKQNSLFLFVDEKGNGSKEFTGIETDSSC